MIGLGIWCGGKSTFRGSGSLQNQWECWRCPSTARLRFIYAMNIECIKNLKNLPKFKPGLLACVRHFEPNCSNPQWTERNEEWGSARNALTYFKGPTKNHIQAVGSQCELPSPADVPGWSTAFPRTATHTLHSLTSFVPLLVFIFANVKPSLWKDRSAYFGRHGQAVTLQTLQASFFTDYRLLIHCCKNALHACPVGFRGSFFLLAKTFHFISYHSQIYFDYMLIFISSIIFIFKISLLSEKLSAFLWLLIFFKSE